MKRYGIFFLLVLSILFVNSMALAEEQVVIYYEGFEDVVEGQRPGEWANEGPIAWFVSSLQAQAGQKSLLIEDLNQDSYIAAVSPYISVSANTTYTVAVWAMTDDVLRYGKSRIALRLDGDGETKWLYFPNDRPLGWTLGTLTFTTLSTTQSIRIRLYSAAAGGAGATGRAWFDEVYLVEGTEFVPPKPKQDNVFSINI